MNPQIPEKVHDVKKFPDHSQVGWGYTYFVQHRDAIKIGFSGCPNTRIKSIQVSFPDPLKVLAIVSNTIIDEPTAHRKFAHLRMSGEWFRATPELIEFIEQIKIKAANSPKQIFPPMRARDMTGEIDRCQRALTRLRYKASPEKRPLINDLIEQLKKLPGNPEVMRPMIRKTIELIEQKDAADAR